MAQILVKKADGRLEPLNYNKLKNALRRSGASSTLANEVIELISDKFYSNISTKEIYKLAFEKLSELKPSAAARYALKNALLALGPDGYPFETFIAALLKGRGYSTQLRTILYGKCIQHEIDVIAWRGEHQGHKPTKFIVECKFHNSPQYQSNIQAALYTWARFLDIKEKNPDIDSAWLVTNTKFSKDVITYSDCVGLKLLGWSFPEDESIQIRIEENKLYPITILTHLNRRDFLALHEVGIITLKDLLFADEEILRKTKIREKELSRLKEEAKIILSKR